MHFKLMCIFSSVISFQSQTINQIAILLLNNNIMYCTTTLYTLCVLWRAQRDIDFLSVAVISLRFVPYSLYSCIFVRLIQCTTLVRVRVVCFRALKERPGLILSRKLPYFVFVLLGV